MEKDMGASSGEDRATAATQSNPQAVSSQAGIPSADNVRLLHAGPDPRGGFTFAFGDPSEDGVIRIIVEHLYDCLGIGTPHELNCVQMEVQPRDFGQRLSLTLQKEGGKTPLALKAEAVRLLQQTLEAIETGRSEPLFVMRDTIRNWLADDVTAQAIEARRAETGTGSVHESAVTK